MISKARYFLLLFLLVETLLVFSQTADSLSNIQNQNLPVESISIPVQSRLNFSEEIRLPEQLRIQQSNTLIDSLLRNTPRFAVVGSLNDTLFFITAKIGPLSARERAESINKKLKILVEDDFLKIDSIKTVNSDNTIDIVYGEQIIMSISETDAFWDKTTILQLADENLKRIKQSLINGREENSISNLLMRIGLVLLVLVFGWFLYYLVGKGFFLAINFIDKHRETWLKDLSYKDYTFLTAEQEVRIIHLLLNVTRWFMYILLLYIALPLIFSIFPFTRGWADYLFGLVWSPLKGLFISVWKYLPNLFAILVIYFVMKYFIRFVKYIFSEIEQEKLKLAGFHADWAMPTYSIIRILLYAFMFVLIFPYLPGSDSNIFKGVSVFIGILFSLGSSSAISNMIAGLVITYMRPFKIGDRIKIGEVTGDVVEKTLLVTRIKTIKNEIITIPNSAVLSGNTTNFSSEAVNQGLIIHSTVTIGYDVPWKDMHQVLIDSALKTSLILKTPKPFVLQTSLDDFYVSYQINAYTREPNKQALIYSALHQNIQDLCNERGIEILSPHYRAQRDGNRTSIPESYLAKDYIPPAFSVQIQNDKKNK